MGKFKMPYVVEKYKGGKIHRYWQPKKRYLVGGIWLPCPFKPVSLGEDWVLRADELNKALEKWRDGDTITLRFDYGTIGWLVGEYMNDDAYERLEENTKTKYRGCLNILRTQLGDIPADKLSRMSARAFCLSFTTKSMPTRMSGACSALYGYAMNIGAAKENPFCKMRLSRPKPRRVVVSMELFDAIQNNAIKIGLWSVALAMQIALDMAQRATDVRTLTWAQRRDGRHYYTQNKTDELVGVMETAKVRSMMDKTPVTSPIVLICEHTGKPYSKDMLCRKFREACKGIEGAGAIQFRDLRRTFMVRGGEKGLSGIELSAVSGHSIDTSTKILETYIPRNQKMADNTIAKMEKPE